MATFVGAGILSGVVLTTNPQKPVEIQFTSDLKRTEQLEKKATTPEAKKFYQLYGRSLQQLKNVGWEGILFDPLNPRSTRINAPINIIENTDIDQRQQLYHTIKSIVQNPPISKNVPIDTQKQNIRYLDYLRIARFYPSSIPRQIDIATEIAIDYFDKNKSKIMGGINAPKPKPVRGALLGALAGTGAFAAWKKRKKIIQSKAVQRIRKIITRKR